MEEEEEVVVVMVVVVVGVWHGVSNGVEDGHEAVSGVPWVSPWPPLGRCMACMFMACGITPRVTPHVTPGVTSHVKKISL
jgi:hypothetical protein